MLDGAFASSPNLGDTTPASTQSIACAFGDTQYLLVVAFNGNALVDNIAVNDHNQEGASFNENASIPQCKKSFQARLLSAMFSSPPPPRRRVVNKDGANKKKQAEFWMNRDRKLNKCGKYRHDLDQQCKWREQHDEWLKILDMEALD